MTTKKRTTSEPGRLGRIVEKIRALFRRAGEQNFTCDVCGREVFEGERICAACFRALPWNRLFCPLCGRKVGEAGVCVDCKAEPLGVDRARSCFTHDGEASRLVYGLKDGKKYLAVTLGELLAGLADREFADADAVTFVPMTERAEKRRGYNQSRLLAEEVARRCGKELIAPAVKQRDTEPQKALGRRARAENLKGCFHVRERKIVRGKRILLVDDVMTTGATGSELADVLRRAGAERVYLLTATSVTHKNPFGLPDEKERKKK